MGITVTTAAALANSGNAAPGSASSAGSPPGVAAEFAALLAGQVSELGQFLQNDGNQITLAMSGLPGQTAAGKDIAGVAKEDTEDVPLDAIALFDAMVAHATAKPAQEASVSNTASPADTDASRGMTIGEGGRQQAPTALNILAQRQQPADPLAGNGEAAKLAGETEIVTPSQFANALSAHERPAATPRPDNQTSIAAPLHDPRWSQQLGEKVVWLTRGDIQNAQINITPAQLGPIQINISLNGDQMTAHFVSAHQEVRQALEDAMPRLREMLSGAGINLGQSNVGSQAQQQQQAQQQTGAQFGETPRSINEDAILSADTHTETGNAVLPAQRGRGMVDLFA